MLDGVPNAVSSEEPGMVGGSELLCLSGLVITEGTSYVTKEDLASALAGLENKFWEMFKSSRHRGSRV